MLVRYIFDKIVREGYGTFRLSEEMNNMGIKTHAGAKFQPNNINRLLRNKIYIGIHERGGKVSPINVDLKIIDEDVFFEAQRILGARRKEGCDIVCG